MAKQYQRAVIPGKNGGFLNNGPTKPESGGRKPSKSIIDEITELMQGDGFVTIEGELLGDDGERTGKFVKVRAAVPNQKAAARAYATNMKKGDVRTLQLYLDRTMGKVPQPLTGADGGPINIENNIGQISDAAVQKMIEIAKSSA